MVLYIGKTISKLPVLLTSKLKCLSSFHARGLCDASLLTPITWPSVHFRCPNAHYFRGGQIIAHI